MDISLQNSTSQDETIIIRYTYVENVLVYVGNSIILVLATIVLFFQWKNRKQTMQSIISFHKFVRKNYRYYFHMMLLNLMIVLFCQILDMLFLSGYLSDYFLYEIDKLEPTDRIKRIDIGCQLTGALSVFMEFSAFVRLVWFSYLLKRMITSPTSNFKALSLSAHVSTLIKAIIFLIVIYTTIGFGLSTSLSCGISLHKNQSYFDFVRCWPILVIPFCLYNLYFFHYKVPTLIKSSVKYFIFQYSFYIFFFTISILMRIIYLLIYIFKTDVGDTGDYVISTGKYAFIIPRVVNKIIQQIFHQLLLITQQAYVLSLIFVISLSNDKIDKLLLKFSKDNKNKDLSRNNEVNSFSQQLKQLLKVHYNKFNDEDDNNENGSTRISKVAPKESSAQKRIDMNVSDEQFKANYDPAVLKKQSTLVLKTSFHTINLILTGICQMFLNIKEGYFTEEQQNMTLKQKAAETKVHKVDCEKFMEQNNELCIYDIPSSQPIELVEFAPQIFKDIRKKCGISEEELFQSFAPIHNFQAIHNFFTGSGKSSSFFFFTDNKTFVLKTLKESEKCLLLDHGVLENYYNYIMNSDQTLLSEYYGVFSIRVQNMQEISCFIMDNLLGKDFMNIKRIYDLKGSMLKRKVKLSDDELKNGTGLRVLKDLNFLELQEKMDIPQVKKNELLKMIEKDAQFLADNRLMDYSLLFIKTQSESLRPATFKRMPAIVFVKTKSGANRLQVKEVDDDPLNKLLNEKAEQLQNQDNRKTQQLFESHLKDVANTQGSKQGFKINEDEEFKSDDELELEDPQQNQQPKSNDSIRTDQFKSEELHSQQSEAALNVEKRESIMGSFKLQLKQRMLLNVQNYLQNTHIKSQLKNNSIVESNNREFTYRMGVIDFLTDYNATKKMENTLNNVLHWNERDQASCQDPQTYADRFIKFLKKEL